MGDTARELAVRNGFKKIAKLLAPSKGETIKVSASLTLKKFAILDFQVSVLKEFFREKNAMFSQWMSEVLYLLRRSLKQSQREYFIVVL